MINFMLPMQVGAMTLDGTWLIALGIIIVAGIFYKNRNNISLTSTETNKINDSNVINNVEKVEDISISENNSKINNLEEENITLEKEELIN